VPESITTGTASLRHRGMSVLCRYLNWGTGDYLCRRALNSAAGTAIWGGLAFYASGVKQIIQGPDRCPAR